MHIHIYSHLWDGWAKKGEKYKNKFKKLRFYGHKVEAYGS